MLEHSLEILIRLAEARSPEVWTATLAGMLYVFRKSEQKTQKLKFVDAGMAGLIGFSVGPAAAHWADVNEALGVVLVTSLGYLVLDVLTAIVADGSTLREVILRIIGGKRDG